jgi:hypothetical protein
MVDPRLKEVIVQMNKFKPKPNVALETLNLDFDQFRKVLSGNLPLLVKILRNDLIIPEFPAFCESVTALYNKLRKNFDGEVINTAAPRSAVPRSAAPRSAVFRSDAPPSAAPPSAAPPSAASPYAGPLSEDPRSADAHAQIS